MAANLFLLLKNGLIGNRSKRRMWDGSQIEERGTLKPENRKLTSSLVRWLPFQSHKIQEIGKCKNGNFKIATVMKKEH